MVSEEQSDESNQYPHNMEHYVYFLLMKDGRIYVGETANITHREKQYLAGKGGKTTVAFGGERIIYYEIHPDRQSALKRERQIKRWTHAKKLALATGNTAELKKLSKSTATKQTTLKSLTISQPDVIASILL